MRQRAHTRHMIDGDTFGQRTRLLAGIPIFIAVELIRWRRTYVDPWRQCIRITLAMAQLRLFSHYLNPEENLTKPKQTCAR